MNDIIVGVVAIILGVAGSWAIYWLLDFLVRLLPAKTQDKLRAISNYCVVIL
jgi:hypothetical protein